MISATCLAQTLCPTKPSPVLGNRATLRRRDLQTQPEQRLRRERFSCPCQAATGFAPSGGKVFTPHRPLQTASLQCCGSERELDSVLLWLGECCRKARASLMKVGLELQTWQSFR